MEEISCGTRIKEDAAAHITSLKASHQREIEKLLCQNALENSSSKVTELNRKLAIQEIAELLEELKEAKENHTPDMNKESRNFNRKAAPLSLGNGEECEHVTCDVRTGSRLLVRSRNHPSLCLSDGRAAGRPSRAQTRLKHKEVRTSAG
ncbi:Centrosomal protein of 162 kDa [Manis javanica]|nr:Centrosomal protein of 162 kDa [Manis javanica]